MRHLRNRHLVTGVRWWAVALCCLVALQASAYSSLSDLNIRVVLSRNGDARITETRQMDIDDEGTECYIVVGNLNGSEVRDLKVSDETGLNYEFEEDWFVNGMRSQKAGKCGIVETRDGYELCWGLGDSGYRTYTTSYTVTNLVKGYDDADGFNYMFVADDIRPYPEHVKLTIVGDSAFTADNTAIWAFRYRGDISFDGNAIVAETSESFGSSSAMVVMCQFRKGLFAPQDVRQGSFEDIKNTAFEGSDYDDEDDWGGILIFIFFAIGFVILPGIAAVYHAYAVWRARKKANKDLLWYRDIPLNGNLQQANNILNAYRYVGADYNNLLSACILKLIDMGAISIEQRLNEKGKTEQNFVVHDLQHAGEQPVLLRKIHSIFQKAAGSDTILEPRELKSYMKSSYNSSIMDSFINTLHTKTSIWDYKDKLDDVRQVFGLRKFLKEFSLLDERHVNEVALWKDYMIYATLFGIADQVIKDMKKINPEYFNMDQVAGQMADDMTLPMIYSTMHASTSRAAMSKAEREARASGGGGSSSWGGGGGFSGGGSGGGIR